LGGKKKGIISVSYSQVRDDVGKRGRAEKRGQDQFRTGIKEIE